MTASLIVSKFIITDPRTLHFPNISVKPIRFDLYNRANHNLALAQKPKHDLHYRKEFISITLILSVSLPLARIWNMETTILSSSFFANNWVAIRLAPRRKIWRDHKPSPVYPQRQPQSFVSAIRSPLYSRNRCPMLSIMLQLLEYAAKQHQLINN